MGFRVIQVDTTAGTAVNPSNAAGAQIIKTYPLSASDDEWISVTAVFQVTTTASSSAQSVPLQIVVGPNTYANSQAITAVANNFFFTFQFRCVSRAGDTITVQIPGSLTADTHTSINVVAFYVDAMSGIAGGT